LIPSATDGQLFMEALGSAAGRATSATRLVTSLAPEVISASRTDPMEAFATLFGEGPREWETMKGQIHSLASAATIVNPLSVNSDLKVK
jgi:hypothetical protein